MGKGRGCSFCALPVEVRDVAVAQWKSGTGTKAIADSLREQGFGLTNSMVDTCLTRSTHHGRRDGRNDGTETVNKIAQLLIDAGIDSSDIGGVTAIRLSEWDALTKNDDGEAQIHHLSGASVVLSPSWDTGPKWEPVDRGKAVVIRADKRKPKTNDTGHLTAVVLPDPQIGYWRDITTGALTPFHDELAIDTALRAIALLRPDVVVLLGDYLDLAPMSDKFSHEAGFALTVQPALDYGVQLLARIRALVPDAKIALIEGNHDRRLQKSITNNALDSFGLRRGDSPPESWPVLSVPYLLRLDELDVEYVAGYPAGEYWLSDRLLCIHGRVARGGNVSTAAAVIEDERVSIIFGHIHRIEEKHKTRRVRHGRKMARAVSPGCLCRIDGTVPSSKGSTDVWGRPVPTVEDWQQGFAVVTYEPEDGPFGIELVPIYTGEDETTFLRGKAL